VPAASGPLPGTGVTPSDWNTCAERICGVAVHMPPVAPAGSLSTIVAFQASVVPVFCTLRLNCPNCPRFIVAGPPLVRVRAGGVGAATWIETLAEAVCGGLFQVTTPVLVTVVPTTTVLPSMALKRRSMVAPGASEPG